MANLNVRGYFRSLGQIDNIAEAMAAAQNIVDNPQAFGGLGSSAPVAAARGALIMLNDFSKNLSPEEAQAKLVQARADQEAGVGLIPRGTGQGQNRQLNQFQRALSFLSGEAQPSRFGSFFRKAQKNINEMEKDLRNERENLANVSALPVNERTAAQNKQIESRRKDVQEKTDALASVGGFFGEQYAQGFSDISSRTQELFDQIEVGRAQGFEPTASGGRRNPNQTVGREGQPTTIREEADGTFSIVGATNGEVLQSGLPNLQDALATQTERQSGSRPNATGAFAPPPQTPGQEFESALEDAKTTLGEDYVSTILPDGFDLSGFTEPQIKDMEQAFLNAGKSKTVMDKVFDAQPITDEDVQAFYDEAFEFIAGEGSAFAQQFTRAKEDFTNELEFQAEERRRALELETINAREEKRGIIQNLEALGRTFTGESARQLGEESAFTDDTLGTDIPEGLFQEGQRLLTSSSEARFNKGIRDFGRGTEEFLGSANISDANIPEIGGKKIFDPTSGVRGSLERSQETAVQTKADTLQQAEIDRRQEILAGEGGTTLN